MSHAAGGEDAGASVARLVPSLEDHPSGADNRSAPSETERLEAECNRLSEDLARLTRRCATLQEDRDYLSVHAVNLERQARRLRRESRALAMEAQALRQQADAWKALYQAVVTSRSWRAIWWLGTPYRVWIDFRGRRARR